MRTHAVDRVPIMALLALLLVHGSCSGARGPAPNDDPYAGWPEPNWTTVPTYTFCGPNKREFNAAELAFLGGKTTAGYTPRWMALGYITLANVPPLNQASCAKQIQIRDQIKEANPHMPVWRGDDWGLLLCDAPTNLTNKNATCLNEYDEKVRADPKGLLYCDGKLSTRSNQMGRALKNWQHNKTRQYYTDVLPSWDGVFWDGLQHRFDRAVNPSDDYPTDDGAQSVKCSVDDQLNYHAGEIKMVKDGRAALGWGNVTICNDDNGNVMDVFAIYKMARWSARSGQRYMAAIRGYQGAYPRNLAGFLVAAGRDHYFLQFAHYACDTSNGQPPFANSQLEHRPEYSKALGEPEDTQVHSFAVTEGVDGESAARVAVPSCECLVGNDATRQGAVPPAHDPLYPVPGTCMEWDADCESCQRGSDRRCKAPATVCNQSCVFISKPVQTGDQTHQCLPWSWVKSNCPGPNCPGATAIKNGSCSSVPPLPPQPPTAPSVNTTQLWLGTTDLRPAYNMVANLSAGVDRCECVLTRRFSSGTTAYYNATSWRAFGSIFSSDATCVLWSDNSTLENAGGCAEARAFLYAEAERKFL